MAETCARCGAPFRCGIADPEPCWCAAVPPVAVPESEAAAGCLCPACLEGLAAAARPAEPQGR